MECPFCEADIDLFGDYDAREDLSGIEVGEHMTDKSRDVEVQCPSCKRELVVDLEY
jgi:C4-type Zn-finger protein